MIDRRSLLTAGGASVALTALGFPADALAAGGIKLSQPRPFSFERLVTEAKALAGRPYVADTSLPADVLQRIDYDAHGKIKYLSLIHI